MYLDAREKEDMDGGRITETIQQKGLEKAMVGKRDKTNFSTER